MSKDTGYPLGKAFVQIMPSARGITQNINQELNNELGESAGSRVGTGFVNKIKGVMAAAGIGLAVKKAISEGANLEQSIGGIETLFGESSDKMIAYAQEAFRTVGISANDYMQQATSFSASLLQSLGGDTVKAADIANMALIDMGDNANKMGTSMEMIQNAYQGFAKQNYTMLDNLKLGYGGTKTEMERLLADATKLSGIEYNISNLSDVYEAIHVIQGEIGITGTTAAEATETISGSFGALKAALKDLLGYIVTGEGSVNDAISNLVTSASTFLFKNLVPALGNIISNVPNLIAGFVNEAIPELLQCGNEIMNEMVLGIEERIPNVIATSIETVTTFINGILSYIPTLVQSGSSLLMSLVNGILANLPALINSGVQIIVSLIQALISNFPTIVQSGIEIVSNLVAGLIRAIPNLVGALPQLIRSIIDTFRNTDWAEVGRNIITGIVNGLSNAASAVLDMIKTIAKNALTGIKNFLGIKSPSRVFRDQVGKMIDLGLASGIKDNMGTVQDSMRRLSEATTNSFDSSFTYGAKYVGQTSEDIINAITPFMGDDKPIQLVVNDQVLAQVMYNPLRGLQTESEVMYG